MGIADLVKKLRLEVLSGNDLSADIDGVYIGDLLSHVMSKAQQGNIWLTVQTNVNIVAVASLCDVACIILPEGIKPDSAALQKAEAEEIIILSYTGTAFEFITEYNKP